MAHSASHPTIHYQHHRQALMSSPVSSTADTGLEVIDVLGDAAFAARPGHARDIAGQMDAMKRIADSFLEKPESILQELVNAAVELCGADSAGISIVKDDSTDESFYHWVATAGQYSGFLNAVLPRYPSACGITLERGRAQLFRVNQAFFDIMGISAPLVTDGILLPWQVDGTQGTIFVMAHGRNEAFNADDYRVMQILADFAAMGVRQQRQQKLALDQARAAAAAAMANDLAHKINNPLQSLTNILYLASQGDNYRGAREVGEEALPDLKKLSELVQELLTLPLGKAR